MRNTTEDDVLAFVITYVNRRLEALGREQVSIFPDDYDLLDSGLIDSLDLVELMAAVEKHFAREFDFAELDPDSMTLVGPLCTFLSDQLTK